MCKGPGGALGFPHGTLLPRGRGQSQGCYALPARAGYTNGAGQGLWSLSSLFGLWAAGLGPSGAVAVGQSTTEYPATHLDAGTQARSVVLDSSFCSSRFALFVPFQRCSPFPCTSAAIKCFFKQRNSAFRLPQIIFGSCSEKVKKKKKKEM